MPMAGHLLPWPARSCGGRSTILGRSTPGIRNRTRRRHRHAGPLRTIRLYRTLAPGRPRRPRRPGYLAELTRKAEAVQRLAIAKKKDDPRAFGDWIDHQFRADSDKLTTAYGQWAEAYEQWQEQRPRHGGDGPPPPDKPLQLDRIPTSELKAAYDKEVESSYDWIVPAFREWAASDPDVFTGHIAAMRGVEGRLGDGEALRLATSAQINLASQWDGAHCTNLRNFLGALLVVPGNQQAVARTLRELLEAEQALYRQAQGNMLQLADNVRPAIEASGDERKPETRTHLTILSAVAWIAGATLAIPSGGASLYAGMVTLNAIAAVSGAAASLLPAGSAKSLSADTVDGVLEKTSEVMAQARSDLAEREKDITSALQHNLEASRLSAITGYPARSAGSRAASATWTSAPR